MFGLKKTVWITRTFPGADATAKRVAEKGFTPLVSPLLTLSPPDRQPALPTRDTVLIFTSKNGIDAFCRYFKARDYSVITVGPESAIYARNKGFKSVKSAYGTADSVTEIILKTVKIQSPILHCAGRHVRGRIIEDVIEAGYEGRRDLYYCSKPVDALPEIDLSCVSSILLFSPLAAKTLSGFKLNLSQCVVISISQNTDAALGGLIAASRKIARNPTENAVLACLSA